MQQKGAAKKCCEFYLVKFCLNSLCVTISASLGAVEIVWCYAAYATWLSASDSSDYMALYKFFIYLQPMILSLGN